jgi:GT2 family glycosyltransferase
MLGECLRLVEKAVAQAGAAPIEVIVTDDSQDARTREVVGSTYPWVRWVRGPRRGPAANRNAGVAAASGSWVIFTDDDCLPEPLWLREYLGAMRAHPSCNVFEGRTVADRERRRLDEESPTNMTGGYLWSCNMAIRRKLFDSMGGFCESFPHAAMEDVDLRLRLEAQHEAFPFVFGATVCHPLRSGKGVRFTVKAGRSYLHLVARHPVLLGRRPWLSFAFNCARRIRQLLREAAQCRGRGLAQAIACLAVAVYFEAAARIRGTRSANQKLQPAA